MNCSIRYTFIKMKNECKIFEVRLLRGEGTPTQVIRTFYDGSDGTPRVILRSLGLFCISCQIYFFPYSLFSPFLLPLLVSVTYFIISVLMVVFQDNTHTRVPHFLQPFHQYFLGCLISSLHVINIYHHRLLYTWTIHGKSPFITTDHNTVQN